MIDDTIGFQPKHTPYPSAKGKGVIPKHRGEQLAPDARSKGAQPLRKVSDKENCRPPPCRRR